MLLKHTSTRRTRVISFELVIVMKNNIRMKMIMIVCCFEKFM